MASKARNHNYVVAGCKPWNARAFDEVISKYPGKWHFISDREQLNLKTLRKVSPRYIFFVHWSWKVSSDILNKYECVCFHMTDVPFGRGGSPLQNLILHRIKTTKLTALRMSEELDTGPVYLKEHLSLEGGTAEEIYVRANNKASEMIRRIISEQPAPVPQSGKVTIFRRRQPRESEIPCLSNLEELYDFIRMLDAEGYPRAFLEVNGMRFEFSRAALYNGRVVADVTITKIDGSAGGRP